MNGDGYADVLIAAPAYAPNGFKHGRVMVEYGSPNGLSRSSGWSLSKPWLIAVQQQLTQTRMRLGTLVYWGPPLLIFIGLGSALLLVRSRLRRRIAGLLVENRELTLATERARIARDMHDQLGADVTQLIFRAEQAQKIQPVDATGRLAEISNSARRVVDTISELVWATDPVHDTLESFISYLAEFTQGLLQTHGIACELDLPVAPLVCLFAERWYGFD